MKTGVLLSGCGVYDGSEIHESVLTLLHLAKQGCEIEIIAPNILQAQVINHLTEDEIERENRDVLVEAARIARGDIQAVDKVDPAQLDALILPGGAGAIKNLTNYAFAEEECRINPQTKELIQTMVESKKPVGAICISPLVVAKALADTDYTPRLTVGSSASEAAQYIAKELAATHVEAAADEIVVDEELKLLSTPAYMLADSITEVDIGVAKLVEALLELS